MSENPQENERVVFAMKKHWAAYFGDIFKALFLAAASAVLFVSAQHLPTSTAHFTMTLLFPFTLLVVWMELMVIWMKYSLSLLILTDRHVYYLKQSGVFQRAVYTWNVLDIKDVGIGTDGFLPSYFNFGSLSFVGRSGAVMNITGIPDPEFVSNAILKQDRRYEELMLSAESERDLLAYISHEVKGHLTKNKAAFAAIVEGDYGPVSEPLKDMAALALSDTEKGVDMVVSVLRPKESAAKTKEKKPFDLSGTLEHLLDGYKLTASSKGLEIRMAIARDCVVEGDEQEISRFVLANLLENAIHYTAVGGISVELRKHGFLAEFTIEDTGIGLSGEDMRKLFTKGGHGRDSVAMNKESTGYGLYIAKKTLAKYRGTIRAESQGRGKGSRFIVQLPLAGTV